MSADKLELHLLNPRTATAADLARFFTRLTGKEASPADMAALHDLAERIRVKMDQQKSGSNRNVQ